MAAQQPRIDKAAAVDHTEFVVADHIHSRHIVAADHYQHSDQQSRKHTAAHILDHSSIVHLVVHIDIQSAVVVGVESDSTAVVAVSGNIEFAAAAVVVVVVAEQRSSFARSQRIPTRTAFGADVLMAAEACRTFRPLASARF